MRRLMLLILPVLLVACGNLPRPSGETAADILATEAAALVATEQAVAGGDGGVTDTPGDDGAAPTEPPAATAAPTATSTLIPTPTVAVVVPTDAPPITPVDAIPVRFAPGTTGHTITGSMPAGGVAAYDLRVQDGQWLVLALAEPAPGGSLRVSGVSDGEVYADNVRETRFPAPSTQDYRIEVRAAAGADFRVEVGVPARVSYAQGATTVELRGDLSADTTDYYVLRLLSGQQLEVTLAITENTATMAVLGLEGGEVLLAPGTPDSTYLETKLPRTQDYLIAVTASSSVPEYGLNVTAPARIVFDTGATEHTVNGVAQGYSAVTYLLQAGEGQRLTISLSSPDGDVYLSVVGSEDGQPFLRAMMQETSITLTLPATQDYRIGVHNNNEDAVTFSMDITAK